MSARRGVRALGAWAIYTTAAITAQLVADLDGWRPWVLTGAVFAAWASGALWASNPVVRGGLPEPTKGPQ